jgi:hypothetical protein
MRPGIQALESRYATLQKRADQGGLGAARMDKIQNRLGRLQDMGATGMRGAQPQGRGMMSGIGGQRGPAMAQQMNPYQGMQQKPLFTNMNDLMARPNMTPPTQAAPTPEQPPMRSSVMQGGKFIQPGAYGPAGGAQPVDPTTGQPQNRQYADLARLLAQRGGFGV